MARPMLNAQIQYRGFKLSKMFISCVRLVFVVYLTFLAQAAGGGYVERPHTINMRYSIARIVCKELNATYGEHKFDSDKVVAVMNAKPPRFRGDLCIASVQDIVSAFKTELGPVCTLFKNPSEALICRRVLDGLMLIIMGISRIEQERIGIFQGSGAVSFGKIEAFIAIINILSMDHPLRARHVLTRPALASASITPIEDQPLNPKDASQKSTNSKGNSVVTKQPASGPAKDNRPTKYLKPVADLSTTIEPSIPSRMHATSEQPVNPNQVVIANIFLIGTEYIRTLSTTKSLPASIAELASILANCSIYATIEPSRNDAYLERRQSRLIDLITLVKECVAVGINASSLDVTAKDKLSTMIERVMVELRNVQDPKEFFATLFSSPFAPLLNLDSEGLVGLLIYLLRYQQTLELLERDVTLYRMNQNAIKLPELITALVQEIKS